MEFQQPICISRRLSVTAVRNRLERSVMAIEGLLKRRAGEVGPKAGWG